MAFIRLFYWVPLIGWMLRDAFEGREGAVVWFLANLVMLWVLAVMFFSYPAVIIPAIAAVPIVFVILIGLTAGKGA